MSIEATLDEKNSILFVRPRDVLRSEDFETLSQRVDPFIERTGTLKGLILEIESFPGWDGVGTAIDHFRFVRNHHRNIARVAIVTDSPFGDVADKVGAHFVSAEIEHFPSGHVEEATQWIKSGGEERSQVERGESQSL